MSKFSIVEIEGVNSSVPRSEFDEADLDTLADSILESGGILKPLILRKIGFEKYEVIDGHFEYYAAVRAREKNPNRGEIVNAFIIPAEKEDAALNQVAFLKSVDPQKPVSDISQLFDQKLQPIHKKMTQMEQLLINISSINKIEPESLEIGKLLDQKLQPICDQMKEFVTYIKKIDVEKRLSSMTKNELLELAKQKNVKIAKSKTKAEIINAIIHIFC